ncbi:MAG: hypothetical protein U9N02_00080 [Campylobacterota bacterium]|nr:hypothetical protein [Campylobacterota bacterium]
MKIIWFLFFLCLNIFATDDFNLSSVVDANETNVTIAPPLKKVLYLSYEKTPKRVVQGEIFSITVKTISTIKHFLDIKYNFSSYYGLELLNEIPYREIKDRYYYDTFYFYTNNNKAKLPNITANIEAYTKYKTTTILGEKLNIITLNPKSDFSNIIANSLELLDYSTTNYNKDSNTIVLELNATNTKLEELKFKNVIKQGIESVSGTYLDSKITYYLIIDKKFEKFSFSYFNLIENKFLTIDIPIIVEDYSIATQTDLKPRDQSKDQLKINIAAGISFFGFMMILWRKKYIYLFLILLPLLYILYLSVPQKDICIKKGSNIYLLPVRHGTIFEKTLSQRIFKKEGSVKEFVKVKLKNNKIGWVKNEDICTY